MSYVATAKRVLRQIEERERTAAATKSREGEGYGPGRPSPENASRSVEDRLKEALELLGELTYLYNERAYAFQFAGLSRAEAECLSMSEVKQTDAFRRWKSLG